jgi:hypothetical protein
MKDRALEIVAARPATVDGRNVLREYLQSRVLTAMQHAGAFVPLAFMGGTALRFLYRIARFSEDLDFTLERSEAGFDFAALATRLDRALASEGYDLRLRRVDATAVDKLQVGFAGLLADAGLSPHAEEVLWVKVEVDTRPPAGAVLDVSLVDRFGLLRIQHHDMPSLFAGKLAAVLAREYTKGRDLYDLMWYLTRPEPLVPNAGLLGNALRQTAPDLVQVAKTDWRAAVRLKLAAVDWADARRDVAPFLENAQDVELLEAGTFEALLG